MAPHQPCSNGFRVVGSAGNTGDVYRHNSQKFLVTNQQKPATGFKASPVETIDIRNYGGQLDSEKPTNDGDASFNAFRREIIDSFLGNVPQVPSTIGLSSSESSNHKTLKDEHKRSLPMLLLYDEEGLKLYEKIIHVEEYYPAREENEMLKKYSTQIAERLLNHLGGISKGSEQEEVHIVELGSGNLQKVSTLLLALLRLLKEPTTRVKKVTYYALDVSLPELHRSFLQVPSALMETDLITFKALYGTYDDGLRWLSTDPGVKHKKKCILWLGSSVGNSEDRSHAAAFLRKIEKGCFSPGDMMLISIDGCKQPNEVWSAYNDPKGVTREFILNGLKHANSILGGEAFKLDEWEYVGEWDPKESRHQSFYVAVKDLQIDGNLFGQPGVTISIRRGERVRVERSHKFGEAETRWLWEESGFVEGAKWGSSDREYNFHIVYKPPFHFPLSPEKYAPSPCPTLDEWRELWASWDTVTLAMLPKSKLHSKPIELRNPCIFYLGHIPTFCDIHTSRALGIPIVGKERYPTIFERGIDPDVDNTELCHRHSEIPETWPELDEILEFVKRLRTRVQGLYEDDGINLRRELFEDGRVIKRALQRAIWMAFEHETMHLETFLWMLIQSDSTLPPPGVVIPDFAAEAARFTMGTEQDSNRHEFITIPEQVMTLGIVDPEEDDFAAVVDETRFFGWDNEKPCRQNSAHVKSFQACYRPITNADYIEFLTQQASSEGKSHLGLTIPATWRRVPSDKSDVLSHYVVRTVLGSVPLAQALEWPVTASYDELSSCVKFYGGRIPTANEVRAIYKYARATQDEILKAQGVDARKIDAVNGHLSMNGVTESPPVNGSGVLEENRRAIFEEFSAPPSSILANVGFRRWCLESVVQRPGKRVLRGKGQTGGAWEWTSTHFDTYEGFVPGRLYPEYSADFFDGKHNVVLGGGWATHPRLAGRSTFVNWFQRNYPYTWCTARIVKDLDV